jgi:hypothetical protein
MSDLNPAMTDEVTYCAVHPDRETSLRCNKCERYMCPECAVPTPVGYRCKQCVRQHEDKFYSASRWDYIIVFAVSAILTGIGAAIISSIRIPLLFILILGLPVGGFIAEATLRATQRRRGRRSNVVAVAGVVVGGLIGGFVQIYLLYQSLAREVSTGLPPGQSIPALPLEVLFSGVFNDLSLLLFIAMVAIAVYGRFRMKI